MKSVVFLLGLVTAFPAFAQHTTGNDLLARCKKQPSDRDWCLGFLQGLYGGYSIGIFVGTPGSDQAGLLCVPENVTTGQTADVIVRFLEQNPARRHEGAVWLSFAALREAFPCPSRQ